MLQEKTLGGDKMRCQSDQITHTSEMKDTWEEIFGLRILPECQSTLTHAKDIQNKKYASISGFILI